MGAVIGELMGTKDVCGGRLFRYECMPRSKEVMDLTSVIE